MLTSLLSRLMPTATVLVACLVTGCAGVESPSTASLVNTYWRLQSVDGQPVTVAENQREPHLVLHAEEQRVKGFAGCNHLAGNYRLKGDQLDFEQVSATLMACAGGMDVETRFLGALRATRRWKIEGEGLELIDGAGKSVARFESVYLP